MDTLRKQFIPQANWWEFVHPEWRVSAAPGMLFWFDRRRDPGYRDGVKVEC